METEQFRFGEWVVEPLTNSIRQNGERRQMEPRAMDVLVVLCKAAGEIVSVDELLTQCWRTNVYGDNPVHKTLNQLRRLLGDTARSPAYIETVRKRGYRTLAPVVFELPEPPAQRRWTCGSPFPGLDAFDEEHAPVFYGREEPTRRLVEAVQAQVASGLALQMVLGLSGAGKTSLVRAGLFPALAPANRPDGLALLSTTTFDLADQGEQTLFAALASAMLDLQVGDAPLFDGESTLSLAARLENGREAVLAQMKAALSAHQREGGPFLFGIFIDRFESLFAPGRATDTERQALLSLLEDLARSTAALIVVACRNDFYPHISRQPLLMAGKPNGSHFDLAPPGFAEIAQMIRRPAAAAGLSFGIDPITHARLDDVLCHGAAASPDCLPLLQYCLQELYRLRTDDGELGFNAFRRVGGIEGAIAQRAEQVVTQFDEAQKAALSRVLSLVAVIDANEETVTSRGAPWTALRDEAERQVVGALVESRLFVSELMADVPGFRIAHEAILRHWPRMREWIELHKGTLLERARLANLAARWVREGRSSDLLLPRGRQLDAAQALQVSGEFTLSDDELLLIRLSARRERSRDRLRLVVMVTIVALAVLASALGISATAARELAEKRRIKAESLMGYMLGDFADRLRPLGRLDLLDGVSNKALEYMGAARGEKLSMTALTQRAQALQVIAEVRRSHGNRKGAEEALVAAQEILMEQRAAAPADPDVLKNLGANAYWLGQLAKDRNDLDKAATSWQQYLAFTDELHRLQPDNVDWWIEQSYAHNNLGSLASTRGDSASAAREFAQSIALKRQALEKRAGSHMLMEELADSYSWLGSAREALGELDAAGELYAQEMRIVEQLRAVAPGEALWVRGEARALQHRAANRRARGLDDEALADFRKARQQLAAIMGHDRKNLTWQADVADLELEEQSIAARRSAAAALVAKIKDIHARLAALVQRDPNNVVWKIRAANARTRLAWLLGRRGQLDAARQEARIAVAQLELLLPHNPARTSLRFAAVNAFLMSAELGTAAGDGKAALEACRRAYSMLETATASSMHYQVLDPWVRVNYCLGNPAAAEEAARRLQNVGYRDAEYLKFLSLQKTKGGS